MRHCTKILSATLIVLVLCSGAGFSPGIQQKFFKSPETKQAETDQAETDQAKTDPAKTKRAQVPTGQELTTAQEQITEIYSPAIKRAKTPREKKLVASDIFAEVEENDQLPVKYALLNLAIEVAQEAFALELAVNAVGKMDELFEIDLLARKSELVSALSKQKFSPREGSHLVAMAFKVLEENIAANKPEEASDLAAVTFRIARKSEDPYSQKLANQFASFTRSMKAATGSYNSALRTLESEPNDESANLQAGRFLCFFLNDFEKGCQHLAKSSAGKLRTAAELEIKASQMQVLDIKEAKKLNARVADAWWKVALEEKDRTLQIRIKQRAGDIYENCLSSLEGLAKAKAESRIQELVAFTSVRKRILIVSAKFGSGKKWVDVTETLTAILKRDPSTFRNSSKGLKVKDPKPGWNKITKIWYRIGDQELKVTIKASNTKKINLRDYLK